MADNPEQVGAARPGADADGGGEGHTTLRLPPPGRDRIIIKGGWVEPPAPGAPRATGLWAALTKTLLRRR